MQWFYLLTQFGNYPKTYGGCNTAWISWSTPLKGLLIGASRMDEDITGKGLATNPFNPGAGLLPYSESSKADWTTNLRQYSIASCGSTRSIAVTCATNSSSAALRECMRRTRL